MDKFEGINTKDLCEKYVELLTAHLELLSILESTYKSLNNVEEEIVFVQNELETNRGVEIKNDEQIERQSISG